jgi:hypothetical protein
VQVREPVPEQVQVPWELPLREPEQEQALPVRAQNMMQPVLRVLQQQERVQPVQRVLKRYLQQPS